MWVKFASLLIQCCLPVLVSSDKWIPGPTLNQHYLQEASGPISAILETTYEYDSSVIYIVDSKLSSYATSLIKDLDERARVPQGATVMELDIDSSKPNASMSEITPLVQESYWLRKRSWSVIVVILSNDPMFLEIVAQVGKMERLVGPKTKLLVVTEISYSQLDHLISYHWTFSMMSTMFINAHKEENLTWWSVYAFYPFSPSGPQVIKLAAYHQALNVYEKRQLFPDKYRNFHGGVINVTSLEHTPHFMARVETKEDGTEETIIYGSDGMLLHAMEYKLNFTSYLMPAKTWEEVLQFVVDRIAYISPVYWELVPDHLVTHDMTVVYENAYFAFSMAASPAKPHWSGLFLPLTNETWLGLLISCVFSTLALALVLYTKEKDRVSSMFGAVWVAAYDLIATMLDQNFNFLLPTSATGRIMMMSWLTFIFIISSLYKANLKAFLMKPSSPQRAETVEELVQIVDKVTAENYLHSTKVFFMVSDYPPYKKLGDLMEIGYETSVGMQTAVDNKRAAHVDFLKHMNHVLVDKFTKPDGTTALYIGKKKIVHFPACMPVPHDLPFLPHLDHIIMEVVEAGLMEKWYNDEIEITRRKSLRKQREYRETFQNNNEVVEVENNDDGGATSLTMAHLTGPFFLFAAGAVVSTGAFLYELGSKILFCK